ncbi:metallophosphoesterase family protein [Sinorhizobium fredii]|uniref:metallophosphoesterase family protein n=1 Tax=Rhizobium fredii TaxID=380 RepID=UPI00351207D7
MISLYFEQDDLNEKDLKIIIYLATFALPFMSLALVARHFIHLFHRTTPLIEFGIDRGNNDNALLISHISDTHIPETTTIEGGLKAAEVASASSNALSWATANSCFIFLTGDVTDTGSDLEWETFKRLCCDGTVEKTKLFVVPGNHDTTLELEFSPPNRNRTKGFEKRCFNFIDNVILYNMPDWTFLVRDQQISISNFFNTDILNYIELYKNESAGRGSSPSKTWYLSLSSCF